MIMTVVTADGKLQAAAPGDLRAQAFPKTPPPGSFHAGVAEVPGQTIHIVEVPDTFVDLIAEPSQLMAQLNAILVSRGLL